jgi:hypothetical protein
MKTLRQSLIDYELTLLHAIADCRAVPLAGLNKMEAVLQLIEAMLSPVATAIALDDLSGDETAALQFLLANDAQVEAARFHRQFGNIRPMGASRLERERPWQSPVSPAEGLWYRGFIYKAFLVTQNGGQEMVYIPTDVRPLLAPSEPKVFPDPVFQLNPTDRPAHIYPTANRLRENFFSLLVCLQNQPAQLQPQGELTPKARQSLAQSLLPPFAPDFPADTELDLLLQLGQRTNLLVAAPGRLRLNRNRVRDWLQASPAEQNYSLQHAWRSDPTWNDLWRVPGLYPQPTGWENSPLLARSKILGFLQQLNGTPENWYSLNDFVAAVKKIDPDFQRPNGDYDSWYIQDDEGRSLLGFAHWDRVEGRLIRHVLGHILSLLNVVELGNATSGKTASSFTITAAGRHFLAGNPAPVDESARPAYLRVAENFRVRVPAHASLYDRFQLARIAALEQRENNRAIYCLTRASIGQALKNGVTPDQITAFLTRATSNQTPLKVVETLRTWGSRFDALQLEQATLLRLKDGRQLAELRQHPALRSLLGEVLGPTTVLVPNQNVSRLRKILVELGYLE